MNYYYFSKLVFQVSYKKLKYYTDVGKGGKPTALKNYCLLLGRKAMTNLDSILKSRVFTLPTKVHTVKAMVFPVVMYGYEGWSIKKAEC